MDWERKKRDQCAQWHDPVLSVDFLHDDGWSDPYENLYTVIRGAKYFTLLPPTEGRYLKGMCPFLLLTGTEQRLNWMQKDGFRTRSIYDRQKGNWN